MNNVYDPVRQPVLHSAFTNSEQSLEMFGMESLLFTLQQLDKMAEQLQQHFVANVCLKYEGDYINKRGDILFALTDAVRNAAIRIEQVPIDLREDVTSMIAELEVVS
jgi:hypothetical protein